MIARIYKALEEKIKDSLSITDDNFFRTQKESQTALQHKGKVPRFSLSIDSDSVIQKSNGKIFQSQITFRGIYVYLSEHDLDATERVSEISAEIIKIKEAVLNLNDMKHLSTDLEPDGIINITDVVLECSPIAHNEKKYQYIESNISVFYVESY